MVDEVFGTTRKEKEVGAALVTKENMSPGEADALDWRTYNKKLVVMKAKDLRTYEHKNFVFRTRYEGKKVFATETHGSKTNAPVNGLVFWMHGKYFANLGQIGVKPVGGYVVPDGQGGARLPEVSFAPLALQHRPGCPGCNSRSEPWPSAVITIGVARTLPELIEDSKYYFADPSSPVSFCLGIKVYCPTRQMVAFLRERDPGDGGTAKLTWALSFGTEPIGQSSIDVLAREGISQVLGLASRCTGPGIEVFKLVLKKERFFAPFPEELAREVVPHMEKDVVLDFHDMQQWCLGGLNDNMRQGPRESREEAARVQKGSQEMNVSAYNKTGLFAFYKGPRYRAPIPEPVVEVPANLKPIPNPGGVMTQEQVERITRSRYTEKMRRACFKAAQARKESASTVSTVHGQA